MAKKVTIDILSLFSSSFLGQLIHIAALPYLSFYFKKEDIGAFFFFQALVSIGLIFASLQSEQAIVVESHKNSYSNFKKSILILICFTLLSIIVCSLINLLLKDFSSKTSISSWIMLIPFALFISGFNNIAEFLFTHEKKFKTISIVRISRPILIYLFIYIYFRLNLPFPNLLIIGFLSGSTIVLFYLLILLVPEKLYHFTKEDLTIKSFQLYYAKHKKILIFNTLSSGLVTASMQIPYIFISFVFGEKFSAFYGMTMRIIGMPLSLLGQSYGQVFFQKFSSINTFKHSIYPVLKKMITRLYLLGLIPFILLFLFTPQLYNWFLGNEWKPAATLSKILLPWLFLVMITAPISNIASVLGIQQKTISLDFLILLLRVIGLFICWALKLDFLLSMIIFSGISVFLNLLFQYILLNLSKKHIPG